MLQVTFRKSSLIEFFFPSLEAEQDEKMQKSFKQTDALCDIYTFIMKVFKDVFFLLKHSDNYRLDCTTVFAFRGER